MSDSLQFEGSLNEGIKYKIFQMETFSGAQEIAILVNEKPVVVISVIKKKNGSLEIRPIMSMKIRIPGQTEESDPIVEPPIIKPTLEE